jgi:hypothetical protein
MVYDHVGRALLGTYNGQAGSVPTSLSDGQTASYTFNYTVPTTSIKSNMKAVAVLIDQTTGEIVNANSIGLGSAGINSLDKNEFSVYPNPATDVVNVSFEASSADYSVSLMDLQGRVVSSQELSNANGTQLISFSTESIAKGSYIISIKSNGMTTTTNVVVK